MLELNDGPQAIVGDVRSNYFLGIALDRVESRLIFIFKAFNLGFLDNRPHFPAGNVARLNLTGASFANHSLDEIDVKGHGA